MPEKWSENCILLLLNQGLLQLFFTERNYSYACHYATRWSATPI